MVVRLVYALFLFGTGVMTVAVAANGGMSPEGETPTAVFMRAVSATGYLVVWVGLFKVISGGLMFVPRTAPLAVLAALPYSFNILLYVVFLAREQAVMGVLDFLVNAFLLYAYADWYRPLLAPATTPPGESES